MQPGYLLRNRYRIEKALAAGGFGETYLAIDLDYPGQRRVVVKHLQPAQQDPDTLKITVRLFESEARALAEMGESSDRIPALYAYFEEQGQFYLVQELIVGQTLTQEIGKKPLSEAQTLAILQEVLAGLRVVHGKNKIHRDLKPDNIIRRASDHKLVLIDFGAVKEVRQAATNVPNPALSVSIGIGTPGYMPTEQAIGFPRLASDIYAVGAIGIQCLTGRLPTELFDDDILALRWQHLCAVSSEVAKVLDKMVAQRHLDRYGNAAEVEMAIEQIIASRNPSIAQLPSPSITLLASPSPPLAVTKAVANPALVQPLGAVADIGRRRMLRFIGFGGLGMGGAVLLTQLWRERSSPITPAPQSAASPLAPAAGHDPLSPRRISFTSVRLNSTGAIADRSAGSAEIFQEDLGNGLLLSMVKIPAGQFTMGSSPTEEERSNDEEPQPQVVRSFYLGQYLVTQAQWRAVMGDNPANFKGDDRLPVESVTWLESMEFCRKLSKKVGRTYRLPSEAEWEYACRAGTTTAFAFGETIHPAVVNYDGNQPYVGAVKGEFRQKTSVVGIFPPNLWGLYDMHGNVWEWCLNEYVNHYDGTAADGGAGGDTNSLDKNKLRPLRGGSWGDGAADCRAARRGHLAADSRSYDIGLRVVSGSS